MTPAEYFTAIDKARRNPEEWDGLMEGGWSVAAAHNAHLDLCRVILNLHQPVPDYAKPVICHGCLLDWPCPTVQAVDGDLKRMGALP